MEQVVEKKDTIIRSTTNGQKVAKVVLFADKAQPKPGSRSFVGLPRDLRRKVKEGEPVLVEAPDRPCGYVQAVWSGGKVRGRSPTEDVLRAFRDSRAMAQLAEDFAELRRSANDKTYMVCVERVTKERAYVPVRAPSAKAAEDIAPGIGLRDWFGKLEPGHELGWQEIPLPDFVPCRDETEETKRLWHFSVSSKGDVEEVQTWD